MSSLGPNEAKFAQELARIAANDPTLTVVEFHGWGIGDEGAGRLITALQSNTIVRFLGLRGNDISGALVMALAGVLENSTTLKTLDLSGNNFGAEGTRAVARLVRNTSSLGRLFLQNCGIGVEEARALAGALPSNSTLTELDLGGNSIGDVGASLLAGSLPGNSSLIVLNLEDNGISDVGARELAEALPNTCSLTLLDLEGTSISDVGARLLAKALLVNSTVGGINLSETEANEELKRLVNDLADINATSSRPQEALGLKIQWLRNLGKRRLSLLGFEESEVEEEVFRLETVCRVGWLISSGLDGETEEAVALVLDQLQYFPQADHRRGLFGRLLGSPKLGVEVANSVDETAARTLYRDAVQCGVAPGVLMNLVRAHGSLCTCRDVEHHLIPFMLLATMPEAGVGDVMELLLINPSLVESGISRPNEH